MDSEVQYGSAPNIVIAYPSLQDWLALYKPSSSRGVQWNQAMFADFQRRHERTVTEQLDMIRKRATGRAVVAELKARPDHVVKIRPFDFLPKEKWKVGLGALTTSLDGPAPTWAAGVPRCGATFTGKPFCSGHSAPKGTGTGSSAEIYFTASRHRAPDETLLHELIHASRMVDGVWYPMPVNGGYGNQEEFLAILVENIYRSEKGEKRLSDYKGHPIDTAKFLDATSPSPRAVIAGMRGKQPSLFSALAALPRGMPAFNPVRQVDTEYKTLMQKIEAM
ncbi:MAG: hypothetical protein ACJ8F2_10830 [Xanthobacteraceae bacterium]